VSGGTRTDSEPHPRTDGQPNRELQAQFTSRVEHRLVDRVAGAVQLHRQYVERNAVDHEADEDAPLEWTERVLHGGPKCLDQLA